MDLAQRVLGLAHTIAAYRRDDQMIEVVARDKIPRVVWNAVVTRRNIRIPSDIECDSIIRVTTSGRSSPTAVAMLVRYGEAVISPTGCDLQIECPECGAFVHHLTRWTHDNRRGWRVRCLDCYERSIRRSDKLVDKLYYAKQKLDRMRRTL